MWTGPGVAPVLSQVLQQGRVRGARPGQPRACVRLRPRTSQNELLFITQVPHSPPDSTQSIRHCFVHPAFRADGGRRQPSPPRPASVSLSCWCWDREGSPAEPSVQGDLSCSWQTLRDSGQLQDAGWSQCHAALRRCWLRSAGAWAVAAQVPAHRHGGASLVLGLPSVSSMLSKVTALDHTASSSSAQCPVGATAETAVGSTEVPRWGSHCWSEDLVLERRAGRLGPAPWQGAAPTRVA